MPDKDFIKESTKYSFVTTNINHLQPGKIASPFLTTLKMLSDTGRARLPVHSFCPPPVGCHAIQRMHGGIH